MKFCLELKDQRATQIETSGGKGASLALLAQAGFNVPDACILTTQYYQCFISQFKDLTSSLQTLNFKDLGRLKQQAQAIQAHINSLSLPNQTELSKHISKLLCHYPLAVRSSSNHEDLNTASFAGQYHSYLHLQTTEEVLVAIKAIYSAMFAEQVLLYRHRHQLADNSARMAIIMQRMIPAEVAGVLFTMNPINGSLDEAVINASYGIGETVVQGEACIDQYVFNKATQKIAEQKISCKEFAMTIENQQLKKTAVTATQQNLPSLNPAQIATLVAVSQQIESLYDFPQDIEWAFYDKQLYILQSRAITRFPERWTRDESAERFPNPISPLGADFAAVAFHDSLRYAFRLMHLPVILARNKWFKRIDCYVYGNQTLIELFDLLIKKPIKNINDLNTFIKLLPTFKRDYQWIQALPKFWYANLDNYLKQLARLCTVDLQTLSNKELIQYVLAVYDLGADYFLPNVAISLGHGFIHRVLIIFIQCLFQQTRKEASQLYNQLTAYCETKTSEVNHELRKLAHTILQDKDLVSLFLHHDATSILTKLPTYPAFNQLFKQFIQQHGHREIDPDIIYPNWGEEPTLVLQQLKLLLVGDQLIKIESREQTLIREQTAALQATLAACPRHLKKVLKELVRLARLYTQLDDLEHYHTSRFTVPCRNALKVLGGRWHQAGLLTEPDDVFFLYKQALLEAFHHNGCLPAEMKEKALTERKCFQSATEQPPWHLGETNTQSNASHSLQGLAASPGKVSGKVSLILSPDHFHKFQPGSILVAKSTNPGWTPLFFSAIGLVTETGGPLSHGAVIAREVGIPAVMALRHDFHVLQDGMEISIDGSLGIIEILK